MNLPESLAHSPNIPYSEQTLEQLREERDYWDERLKSDRCSPAAAAAAREWKKEQAQ